MPGKKKRGEERGREVRERDGRGGETGREEGRKERRKKKKQCSLSKCPKKKILYSHKNFAMQK